jgi:hypothetical protein
MTAPKGISNHLGVSPITTDMYVGQDDLNTIRAARYDDAQIIEIVLHLSRKLGALTLHYQIALGPQLLVIGRVQERSILAGVASR